MTDTNRSNKWPAILSVLSGLALGVVDALFLPSLLSNVPQYLRTYKGSQETKETATATAFPMPSSAH